MKSNQLMAQITYQNLVKYGPGWIRTSDQAIMSRLR